MKFYHYVFLVLKLAIVVQFVLIIANKEKIGSKAYLITEILFKSGLGIFIELFLYHSQIKDIEFEDKVIISFAGGLLLFDAWFNDLPAVLTAFNVNHPLAYMK